MACNRGPTPALNLVLARSSLDAVQYLDPQDVMLRAASSGGLFGAFEPPDFAQSSERCYSRERVLERTSDVLVFCASTTASYTTCDSMTCEEMVLCL